MYNLASIVEDNVRERPDKTAVVFDQFRLTYQQIDMMASQVAHGLKAIGIEKGDKVALTCPNIPQFPILWIGILKAGAVMVPLSVLLTKREIAYHLTDSESKAYLCFQGTPELPMGENGKAAFDEVGRVSTSTSLPQCPAPTRPSKACPP